jgi:hypothetical protein
MPTGLSFSNISNLNSGQQTVIFGAAIAHEPAAVDPSLVKNSEIPEGHFQGRITTFARLDAASPLQEDVDVGASQQFKTNTLTIEPSEHGNIITYSKRLQRRQMDADIQATGSKQLGVSLREREAKDIIALYDGFSKSGPGTGQTLDLTDFRSAYAYLTTDNVSASGNRGDYGPCPLPLVAALHSEQISDLILDITDATTDGTSARTGLSAEMLQRWWRGRDRVYSIEVFHSGYIVADSTPNAKGALGNLESALELFHEGKVDPYSEVNGSARWVEIGLFGSWGEGERADLHGVEIFSDVTAGYS